MKIKELVGNFRFYNYSISLTLHISLTVNNLPTHRMV